MESLQYPSILYLAVRILSSDGVVLAAPPGAYNLISSPPLSAPTSLNHNHERSSLKIGFGGLDMHRSAHAPWLFPVAHFLVQSAHKDEP